MTNPFNPKPVDEQSYRTIVEDAFAALRRAECWAAAIEYPDDFAHAPAIATSISELSDVIAYLENRSAVQ